EYGQAAHPVTQFNREPAMTQSKPTTEEAGLREVLEAVIDAAEIGASDDCYIIAKDALRRLSQREADGATPIDIALEEAFEAVDEKDWDHLWQMLPMSGHGQFWMRVFDKV